MIHEFAVEPEAIDTWDNFRFIIDQVGVEHGRLISRFPRRWERLVTEAWDRNPELQEVKRTTMAIKLNKIKPTLVSLNRNYDPVKTWMENAAIQHSMMPFRAIIAKESGKHLDCVIPAGDLTNDFAHWAVQRQKIVPRREKELAECAKLLLQISKNILFIDPYFDPDQEKYRNSFASFLEYAFQGKHPSCLEVHVWNDYVVRRSIRIDQYDWKRVCMDNLAPLIPESYSVNIYSWDQLFRGDRPHARYILTEIGGIGFDAGLDEAQAIGPTTDVSLLDDFHYRQRLSHYRQDSAAYKPIKDNSFNIQGRKV